MADKERKQFTYVETKFSLLDFDPNKRKVNGVSAYRTHKSATIAHKSSVHEGDAKIGKFYGVPCVYIREDGAWVAYKYANRKYSGWVFVESLNIYRQSVSLRNN